jgi:LuxR family maltose regulon positive regulatory protein
MVRTASVDDGVRESVRQGLRAVAIAREYADDMLVAALAAYARALYLAGDLDKSWMAALAAIEHPDAEQRPLGHVFARSTLALVAADRGWLDSARYHAQKAKAIVGDVGSSRSWLGANAEIAIGSVFAGEGNLAGAEQELVHAEHFFRDDVATVHHAWLLLLLAQVRCRKGRLDQAETAACEARAAIDELADSGRLHSLAAEVAGELEQLRCRADTGEMILPPTDAEFLVLRLLSSELSAREIAAKLFLSPNTVRSHTRVLYRKLGVSTRADAVARADALGLC